MPFTRNILTRFFFTVLNSRTNVILNGTQFHHLCAREIPAIGVLIKLTCAKVRKKKNFRVSILGLSSRGCQPRGEKFAESQRRDDDDRESERRSLARRRRRAPRRRKLVSCFVAKVKTVTLLSALLVAAPLVCERTRALARPSLNIGEAVAPPRQTAITSHKARLRHGSAIILPYRAVQKGPAV